MFAKQREPGCPLLTSTARSAITPVALMPCNNCSPPPNRRAISTPISSAWAATASLFEMRASGALFFSISLLAFKSDWAEAQSPPLYRQLRYDEDYSYLRTARGDDLFDPTKYIPLNKDGDSYLSFGGEARIRYEYFHNPQWGLTPQDNNGYWLQRYMLHADAHVTEWFRTFIQF